ncbi:MAG: aspartyl/asparaginyl beta-hydroxylase domain-containing protein [Niveispirillum sp.]|uniref:aspartyl/asparaginyl beta-hydroxylase domain-containing protein n=1 Tax=Niveispirillum sp. TaxID=1917217 RepID=UPI003BA8019F
MTALLPWQEMMVGSGLMLSAASSIGVEAALLEQQVQAAIDSVPEEQRNRFGSPNGDWTAITLLHKDHRGRKVEHPPLAHIPILTDLLRNAGIDPFGLYITRQPPGVDLKWHFDHQALHLEICRLLLPVRVPADAFTWIGHEKVAHPPGTLWTGDFSLPHQVENRTDQERIVIAIDSVVTPAIQALFPAAQYADAASRHALAQHAINALLRARAKTA